MGNSYKYLLFIICMFVILNIFHFGFGEKEFGSDYNSSLSLFPYFIEIYMRFPLVHFDRSMYHAFEYISLKINPSLCKQTVRNMVSWLHTGSTDHFRIWRVDDFRTIETHAA